ncbi:MAG: hypothetical protein JXL67_12615 [Calditrichaeota bacterium]|nr:hypothetical protein [Calditrichota bacterium]
MNDLYISFVGTRPFKKWITSVILFPFAIYFIFTRGDYCLIDNANLIIHEAGHFFFSFFGTFIYAAGGTLMQIIFPLIIAFYFLLNGYRTGVQIFIFWLGQNFINISVYAADAQVQRLQLLGNGKHDWNYMLNKINLLAHAETVGYIFFGMAIVVIFFALLLPLYLEE